MSATLIALVAFAAWTGLLVFGLANLRIAISARTKKPLNSYSPSGDDLEGLVAAIDTIEIMKIATGGAENDDLGPAHGFS